MLSALRSRTLIIGDVHGCFRELLALLKKARYKPEEDRLIFVGDLVNKGPDSKRVLEWVLVTRAEVVLGNHDWRYVEALEDPDRFPKLSKQLHHQLGNQASFWKEWIRELPLFIEDEDFLVVHAGLQPGKNPSETEPRILMNIRTWDGTGKNLNRLQNPPWYEFYSGDKYVVFGHWAGKGLVQGKNYIGLDSGCVYGKQLSAVIFPSREIVQVDAFAQYQEITPMKDET